MCGWHGTSPAPARAPTSSSSTASRTPARRGRRCSTSWRAPARRSGRRWSTSPAAATASRRRRGSARPSPSFAADLADLLDAPAVVVGHSLGGGIALQLALDRPDLVRGLVLFAPVSTRGLDFVDDATADRLAHPTPEEQRALLRAAFHRPPDEATTAALLATIERAHPNHIEGAARSMRTFHVEDRLHEIRCPVLLIAGDRDRHVPLRNHLATWAALRRAGLHVEHDAGHVPFVEATTTSARLVRSLLDEVARRDG
ncbi:MAG: alpha/beta hydrolase [Ilumatobacteraceae bacterium]